MLVDAKVACAPAVGAAGGFRTLALGGATEGVVAGGALVAVVAGPLSLARVHAPAESAASVAQNSALAPLPRSRVGVGQRCVIRIDGAKCSTFVGIYSNYHAASMARGRQRLRDRGQQRAA